MTGEHFSLLLCNADGPVGAVGGGIRARMEEYIMEKGGDTSSAETLLDYTNAICSIPDLGNIRNGYETFSGNTVLEEIPECLADA